VIHFACPNPDCRRKYRVPDGRAGKVATCPVCKLRIRVPTLPKEELPEPVEGDLIDEETGAVLKDWRDEVPPEPPPAEDDYGEPEPDGEEDELTDERCYDCGCRIYEGELVRRDVAVGSSYVPSDGDPKHHGRFITHYGRVSLCRRCNKARDDFNRQVTIVVLVILGIVGMFALCGGILGR